MLVSFFRRGSAPVLVCGGLLSAALFSTGLYVAGALCVLVVCGLSGALHRRGPHRLAQPPASLCASSSSRISTSPGGSPTLPVQTSELKRPGIADRVTLEARLQQLASQLTVYADSTREQVPAEPTALLLLTVDAYDLHHERAGAVAADVAMLTLASALSRALPRQADLLARYSRSTFAVLLCATDLPGSLRVAARLRWAITRLGIANPHTPTGLLTVSIGVAVHHDLPGAGPAALLTAAEQTLQSAAQAGHDALEYHVSGQDLGQALDHSLDHSQDPASERRPSLAPRHTAALALPAVRAWTVERSPTRHSPHGQPVA